MGGPTVLGDDRLARGDDFTAIRVDIWWVDAAMDGDGTVTVAWSNEAHAVWSATQDGSGAWSRQRIAPVGSVYYGMTVVVNPLGDTLIGWQAKGGASHPVQVAHRPRSSGWRSAVVLSAVPGNAYGPALAISRHGDAVAAWAFEVAGRAMGECRHGSSRPAEALPSMQPSRP